MSGKTPDPVALLVAYLGRAELMADTTDEHIVATHPQALARPVEIARAVVLQGASSTGNEASWVASFVDGLLAVMPPTAADAASFVEAAGQIVPRLCGPGFAAGVSAAGGDAPFAKPWFDELTITYWIAQDDGDVLITRAMVDDWGVTDDRVTCAARSLLYHKSRVGAETVEEGVDRYAVGDGYDAARVIILEDLEWSRSRGGLWVAMPSSNELLFREPSEDEGALHHFRALAETHWSDAELPLSQRVFRLEAGKVHPV